MSSGKSESSGTRMSASYRWYGAAARDVDRDAVPGRGGRLHPPVLAENQESHTDRHAVQDAAAVTRNAVADQEQTTHRRAVPEEVRTAPGFGLRATRSSVQRTPALAL